MCAKRKTPQPKVPAPDQVIPGDGHTIRVWNPNEETAGIVDALQEWAKETREIEANQPRPSMVRNWPPIGSIMRKAEAEWAAQLVVWFQADECGDRFCKLNKDKFKEWILSAPKGSNQAQMLQMIFTMFGEDRMREVVFERVPEVAPMLETAEGAAAFCEAWGHLLEINKPATRIPKS